MTVNPSDTPNVSVVWVGLDPTPQGDDILTAHLGEHIKVRYMRHNPLVVLTIVDPFHFQGYVRPYLKLEGLTSSIALGSAGTPD